MYSIVEEVEIMDEQKVIVVVDDDEFIRKTFFLILHKHYRVYLAKDSKEALSRFQRRNVDLIITDLKLPYSNGVEMISQFRQAGYKGKVILISAYLEQLDQASLEQLGISQYFTKPLDLEALNASIAYLLN
jgi:two-component system, OmpR family, response regulator